MGCGGSKSVNADGDKVNVIFVIGGPGSGKGTQCKMIKDKYERIAQEEIDFHHL